MTKKVYLDNSATTPLHPEVKDAMIKSMDIYGNASSFHDSGRDAKEMVEAARKSVADFIGAKSNEIVFTAGGSESNNSALNTINCHNSSCSIYCKKKLITSSVEHPSVYNTCKYFEKTGRPVEFLPVDEMGLVSPESLEKIIGDDVGIVSVMYANNEVGTVMPIKELAAIAHKHNAYFHSDAVQALGKVKFNVKDLDVDMMSFSAHKINGPKGIGVLYIKNGVDFCPLILGGHHEENRRAGTENTLGIVGFGKAVEILARDMDKDLVKIEYLRDKLLDGIVNRVSDIKINGHPTANKPDIVNISFKYIEGESILLMLDMEGIEVSTGSACASGSLDPSHVLTAMGLDAHLAHGSIRFSLGRETTEEEIDYVIEKLPPVIERLRKMSPLYKG